MASVDEYGYVTFDENTDISTPLHLQIPILVAVVHRVTTYIEQG